MSGGGVSVLEPLYVEEGSLSETTDLFLEVFAGVGIVCSDIIFLGSASSMLTSGSRGYMFKWFSCAKKL